MARGQGIIRHIENLGIQKSYPANKEPFLNQLARVDHLFIIGITPPVGVFMCIHVNTHVLPVVRSLMERV